MFIKRQRQSSLPNSSDSTVHCYILFCKCFHKTFSIDQALGAFVRRDTFSMVCIALQDTTCITLKKENAVNLWIILSRTSIVITNISDTSSISKDGQHVKRLVTMLLEYIVITTKTGSTISTTWSAVKCGRVRILEKPSGAWGQGGRSV